jgi:CRP/FNR family cyclic AMP-dependent transcriptional regulator
VADFVETLSGVPLFAGLPRRELERLAANMTERTFAAGEAVTTEGEGGIGFFVIQDGTATVSVRGETRAALGPGQYFGEVALIDRGPRSATIVAETDLRCRGMTAWEFRPLVQESPELAWPLLEAMVQRLREAEARSAG